MPFLAFIGTFVLLRYIEKIYVENSLPIFPFFNNCAKSLLSCQVFCYLWLKPTPVMP